MCFGTGARGKDYYLAPEQHEEGALITSSVDLFALGLVLWQALVGTHPYLERIPAERNVERWLRKLVQTNDRRRVVEAAPRAPAGLCDVIERLLQPASSRLATAEEVVGALEPHALATSAETLGRLASEIALDG